MNVLCMLLSNERYQEAARAVGSAVKYLPVERIFLGVSKAWTEDAAKHQNRPSRMGWLGEIKKLIPAAIEVTVFPGADSWEKVAEARFALFDTAAAAGAEWILSVDDDDGVLGCPDLSTLGSRVGAFHTDVLGVVRRPNDERFVPGDVFLRPAEKIVRRSEASAFRGSFYGYRAEAWKEVSPHLDRTRTAYEEWGVVWHLIRLGWEIEYVPKVLQWQGVGAFLTVVQAQKQAKGVSWAMVVSQLESQFCPDESKGRWWQNWDVPVRRLEVEDYWRDDPDQVLRREQLYIPIRKVASQMGAGKLEVILLDHGSGPGLDKEEFEKIGFTYVGADITPDMIARARERYPKAMFYQDDVLRSQFPDRHWPLVVNSAVLPHLPREKIPVAVSELWRIARQCLVIKLFGVEAEGKSDNVSILKGFIYNRLREETWRQIITDGCAGAVKIDWHRDMKRACADVVVATVWR